MEGLKVFGNNQSYIAEIVSTRTYKQVRNIWLCVKRKLLQEELNILFPKVIKIKKRKLNHDHILQTEEDKKNCLDFLKQITINSLALLINVYSFINILDNYNENINQEVIELIKKGVFTLKLLFKKKDIKHNGKIFVGVLLLELPIDETKESFNFI